MSRFENEKIILSIMSLNDNSTPTTLTVWPSLFSYQTPVHEKLDYFRSLASAHMAHDVIKEGPLKSRVNVKAADGEQAWIRRQKFGWEAMKGW